MRIARWIPKATNTHSQNAILIAILQQNGCKNVPQCYILLTLPVLLVHEMRPYCEIRRATFRNLSALADQEFQIRTVSKSVILVSLKKGNVSALLCTAAAMRGNRITEGSLRFKTRQVFARSFMNIKGRPRTSEGNILHDVFITVRSENKGLIR